LQPRNLEKAAGGGCAGISVVLSKVRKSNEKIANKKKRDALVRNDVHWAGQLCILNKFFSDYARSHSRRPCRGRRFRAMKSTMGTFLRRSQT
jgi:hypothetical protein